MINFTLKFVDSDDRHHQKTALFTRRVYNFKAEGKFGGYHDEWNITTQISSEFIFLKGDGAAYAIAFSQAWENLAEKIYSIELNMKKEDKP